MPHVLEPHCQHERGYYVMERERMGMVPRQYVPSRSVLPPMDGPLSEPNYSFGATAAAASSTDAQSQLNLNLSEHTLPPPEQQSYTEEEESQWASVSGSSRFGSLVRLAGSETSLSVGGVGGGGGRLQALVVFEAGVGVCDVEKGETILQAPFFKRMEGLSDLTLN